MLPRVDTNIRPIASIEAPSAAAVIGSAKQEIASRFDLLEIGKQVRGEILARLSDGTFFVKLAGATARMALPANSKVGTAIPLTLLTLTPRPTFLLDTEHGNATTTASFSRQDLIENFIRPPKADQPTISNKVPVPETSISYVLESEHNHATLPSYNNTLTDTTYNNVTEQLRTSSLLSNKALVDLATKNPVEQSESDAASAPTNLSDTGRLINKILAQAHQLGAPSALIGKTSLLNSPEDLKHPEQFARHLQQTISSSGIFYEAHVSDWAEGKMSRADLMREPQAQLGNAATNIENTDSAVAEDHIALAQIIHLQLDALEQQKITWQGNLLPGLPLDWKIIRQDKNGHADVDASDPSWQSIVRFELPNLGVVAATINFHAGQLQLFLRSDNKDTVEILKGRSVDLLHALDEAAAPIHSFNVKHDEQA
jgi:hypothetical protein